MTISRMRCRHLPEYRGDDVPDYADAHGLLLALLDQLRGLDLMHQGPL